MITRLATATALIAAALAGAPDGFATIACAQTPPKAQPRDPGKVDPGKVLATVNGRQIVEGDLRLADLEIGTDLGSLPEGTRRRVLVEYLIETQLLADAAEAASLGRGATFDQRLQYWRRKALRDTYFDTKIKSMVTESDARFSFDEQVGIAKRDIELKASHILVKTEEEAKDLFEKIGHGGDFASLAKAHSNDPGSRTNGGSLGYFGRGQMVPQFEEAAYKLDKGDVSLPVKTQFGWHLIKLEDKRQRQAPDFEAVKDRITASLVHQKAQETVDGMRKTAKIEYVDAELKAQVEADRRAAPAPGPKR